MKSINHTLSFVVLFVMSLFYLTNSAADNHISVEIDEDIEIDIVQIGDTAPTALIWFSCNQGDETEEFKIARKLSERGYTVYFPDMLSAHFLSPTPSNIAKVPQQEVVKVVEYLVENGEADEVLLVGGARAAVPLLKGLSDHAIVDSDNLQGALLITPRILSKKPEPGEEPVYIKEAGLSKHPIRILEGERTPNRWGLPHLKSTLSRSGSSVDSDLIKGVRGYFYLRSEKTPQEIEMTKQFHEVIDDNVQIMLAAKP